MLIFESESFDKGAKLNFKITSFEFNNNQIMFQFFDDYSPEVFDNLRDLTPKKQKMQKMYMIVMYGLVKEQQIFTQSKKIKNILKIILKVNFLEYILIQIMKH